MPLKRKLRPRRRAIADGPPRAVPRRAVSLERTWAPAHTGHHGRGHPLRLLVFSSLRRQTRPPSHVSTRERGPASSVAVLGDLRPHQQLFFAPVESGLSRHLRAPGSTDPPLQPLDTENPPLLRSSGAGPPPRWATARMARWRRERTASSRSAPTRTRNRSRLFVASSTAVRTLPAGQRPADDSRRLLHRSRSVTLSVLDAPRCYFRRPPTAEGAIYLACPGVTAPRSGDPYNPHAPPARAGGHLPRGCGASPAAAPHRREPGCPPTAPIPPQEPSPRPGHRYGSAPSSAITWRRRTRRSIGGVVIPPSITLGPR